MLGANLLNEAFVTMMMDLLQDQHYLWESSGDTFSDDGASKSLLRSIVETDLLPFFESKGTQ